MFDYNHCRVIGYQKFGQYKITPVTARLSNLASVGGVTFYVGSVFIDANCNPTFYSEALNFSLGLRSELLNLNLYFDAVGGDALQLAKCIFSGFKIEAL